MNARWLITFSTNCRLVSHPAPPELAQRAIHAADRLLGARRPRSHLHEQGVVVRRDHRARVGGATVEADAEPRCAAVGGEPAVAGRETALGVLGGQAALQRVAVQADVGLRRHARSVLDDVAIRVAPIGRLADPGALGDADLRLDDVDPGDLLGDGVLDLDARVHLDEVEASGVGIHQELDSAGMGVANRARQP